jgi:hypothetical protein
MKLWETATGGYTFFPQPTGSAHGGRKRSERQEVDMLKLSQKVSVVMKSAAIAGVIGMAGAALSVAPAVAQHHGGGGWHGGGGGAWHGGGGWRGGYWHGRFYGPGWYGWGYYGYPYPYYYGYYGDPNYCDYYAYYYGYCY